MTDKAPLCLYCGYNLTGLEHGTRCPECGKVSVPAALREQVWAVVDSGRRLWALMNRPLAAHPPGWWWALDRPGDVRRSIHTLVLNLALSLLIVLAALFTAGLLAVEVTVINELYDQADPQAETIAWDRQVTPYGLFNDAGTTIQSDGGMVDWMRRAHKARSPAERVRSTERLAWYWSPRGLGVGASVFAWMVLVWAYVAQVGLWTQIRRGLPSFARPQSTIIAASNLQSCKLVFLAVLVVLGSVVEVASRRVCGGRNSSDYAVALWGIGAALAIAATTMWIGALRSDFTHQLVRSRLHAFRIVLLYALVFPALTILAVLLGLCIDRPL